MCERRPWSPSSSLDRLSRVSSARPELRARLHRGPCTLHAAAVQPCTVSDRIQSPQSPPAPHTFRLSVSLRDKRYSSVTVCRASKWHDYSTVHYILYTRRVHSNQYAQHTKIRYSCCTASQVGSNANGNGVRAVEVLDFARSGVLLLALESCTLGLASLFFPPRAHIRSYYAHGYPPLSRTATSTALPPLAVLVRPSSSSSSQLCPFGLRTLAQPRRCVRAFHCNNPRERVVRPFTTQPACRTRLTSMCT